jgi:phage shock protein PspC (stress-responsive transcriptional regulator)
MGLDVILQTLLIVFVVALPGWVIGRILAYLAMWWSLDRKPEPVLRKMFWE